VKRVRTGHILAASAANGDSTSSTTEKLCTYFLVFQEDATDKESFDKDTLRFIRHPAASAASYLRSQEWTDDRTSVESHATRLDLHRLPIRRYLIRVMKLSLLRFLYHGENTAFRKAHRIWNVLHTARVAPADTIVCLTMSARFQS
jgi:hypothetical protein